ncbi:MAG: DUF1592 domain-containing protein [Planctomycetaceae bacterium]|nr:DUF1592 domain-containing protein [Planctomycetaceae bacterium]
MNPSAALAEYSHTVLPLLKNYCYGCHGDGSSEGGVQLDAFPSNAAVLADQQLWDKVLRNVRAGVMPPNGESRPSEEEVQQLAAWIKAGPFAIDPKNIDPGRVTIHRLNRVEYQNTIKALLGVDFNAEIEFPPDAAGMGLDNIADLLTVSPLVFEKYLDAAEATLEGAYPKRPIESLVIPGRDIRGDNDSSGDFVSFDDPPEITYTYRNKTPGAYRVVLAIEVVGLTDGEKEQLSEILALQEKKRSEIADTEKKLTEGEGAKEVGAKENDRPTTGRTEEKPPGDVAAEPPRGRRGGRGRQAGGGGNVEPKKPVTEAHFVVSVKSGNKDEEILVDRVFSSESDQFEFAFEQLWSVEPHKFNFNVIMPGDGQPQPRRRNSGRGPSAKPMPTPHMVVKSLTITPQPTAAGKRYFPLDAPPADREQRRQYIRRGIAEFGLRAFRRPLDEPTLNRLADEIDKSYQVSEDFYESIKPAMAKVLCSPRFLFRASYPLAGQEGLAWGLIDEYSLASRLSYFLWSSMPDDELLELAREGQLRANLKAQVARMMADDRFDAFVENFSGQWLQTRNVQDWTIVESAVLAREGIRSRTPVLTNGVRRAMQQEATMYFADVFKKNKSLLDFIDSDYTFLNAELAEYYGIPGVVGTEMSLVALPEGSPRGGVITAGSTLLVTSTTNRTSPVKRGVFVLDNFLGMRPHDPPPNVPSVEASGSEITDHEPTFREMLELHRQDPACASCHALMDPIGLALDGFNALGKYRESEFNQPIDASGQLASGEEFNGVDDLKAILRGPRRRDFYRCLTTKLMTYALGRGLDYHDTETVDQIVERLEQEDGRAFVLLMGIIESSPFQMRRINSASTNSAAGAN